MKRLVEWLADNGFNRISIWLCERTGGHKPMWYNTSGMEPDMSCRHCPDGG